MASDMQSECAWGCKKVLERYCLYSSADYILTSAARPATKGEGMGNRNSKLHECFCAKATKAILPCFQIFKGTPKVAR